MGPHTEIQLRNRDLRAPCSQRLVFRGGYAAKYDRARALFPDVALDWIRVTQSKAADAINKNQGSHASEILPTRLRDQIDQRGTLARHRDAGPAGNAVAGPVWPLPDHLGPGILDRSGPLSVCLPFLSSV